MTSGDDISKPMTMTYRIRSQRFVDVHLKPAHVLCIEQANNDVVKVKMKFHEHNLVRLRNV